MADREATVALLFDDAGLSANLRDALVAQGARIVYESDLRSFAPAELVGSSANVVVVDLDDPSDADLDRLYDTVEGGHPRLVFNDADVSRKLEGWDRARWARHLAAKLVGELALDPPRPEDARAIEPRVTAMAGVAAPAEEFLDEPLVDDLAITGIHGYPETPMAVDEDLVPVSSGVVDDIAVDAGDALKFSTPLSESDEEGEGADPVELAAELEALLADTDAASLDASDGLETVPSAPVELTELASLDLSGFEVIEEAPPPAPVPESDFDISRFSLASMDDEASPAPQDTTRFLADRGTRHRIRAAAGAGMGSGRPRHDRRRAGRPRRTPPSSASRRSAPRNTSRRMSSMTAPMGSSRASRSNSSRWKKPWRPSTDGDFAHEMFLEAAPRAVRRVIALPVARRKAKRRSPHSSPRCPSAFPACFWWRRITKTIRRRSPRASAARASPSTRPVHGAWRMPCRAARFACADPPRRQRHRP